MRKLLDELKAWHVEVVPIYTGEWDETAYNYVFDADCPVEVLEIILGAFSSGGSRLTAIKPAAIAVPANLFRGVQEVDGYELALYIKPIRYTDGTVG